MIQQDYKSDLISTILNYCTKSGVYNTDVKDLKFYTTTETSNYKSVVYAPSLCIALQGEKTVEFGEKLYTYDNKEYLLICTSVPANIKINAASIEQPYIALFLDFSIEEIYDVISESENIKTKNIKKVHSPFHFNSLNNIILEPIYRLVQQLNKPKNITDYIVPLIKKEIIFLLLQYNNDFIKSYVLEGTVNNQVIKAINEIRTNYKDSINMWLN